MNVLIVAPVEGGSGETVTARYLGRSLVQRGHRVHFAASPFAAAFLSGDFADALTVLGLDGPENVETWTRLRRDFRADAIVFADYPLMFLRTGVVPLAAEPGWEEALCDSDACLVTLDHFGFAQREMGIFMGPPHLCHAYHRFRPIPPRMKIMLPCPMHEPDSVEGRKGSPFRYWDVPLSIPDAERNAARLELGCDADEFVVLHIVSKWAWESVESYGLSFYRHLGELLHAYLSSVGRRVRIVALNNGSLLQPRSGNGVELVNIQQLAPAQFDKLLLSADLLLTENRVSISMGKAVCGLRPAAVLKNSYGILDLLDRCEAGVRKVVLAMEQDRPGTVFPYDCYPTDTGGLLEEIVLYKDNSLTRAFAELEVFGGADTAERIAGLLNGEAERGALREHQQRYVDRLGRVADGASVLEALVAA
ncbi:DUF6365 family protein [Lysobacter panacisoli]|uniref:Glycosyltransferase n=1 Tax=Lysobacter panacisoli TaxID=1255263 RepID=A0ABP9LAX1_9GAMM|nr:DUF6365 family protein [Lysobacter panacisoli]